MLVAYYWTHCLQVFDTKYFPTKSLSGDQSFWLGTPYTRCNYLPYCIAIYDFLLSLKCNDWNQLFLAVLFVYLHLKAFFNILQHYYPFVFCKNVYLKMQYIFEAFVMIFWRRYDKIDTITKIQISLR